jgi:hypothetical protein
MDVLYNVTDCLIILGVAIEDPLIERQSSPTTLPVSFQDLILARVNSAGHFGLGLLGRQTPFSTPNCYLPAQYSPR